LRGLNAQLSTLTTQFRQNVLRAHRDSAVVVDNLEQLDGLPSDQIMAAASAAAARGLHGKWLLVLQNTTSQPILALLENRDLREKIYRISIARGTGGDADNTGIIAQLVRLRAERAQLLGYPNHAAYVLEDETAGDPQVVGQMLQQIAGAALRSARAQAHEIQELIGPSTLQPWDWDYYSALVRKAKYDFDLAEVKPYFELNRVCLMACFSPPISSMD
jgi:peptidyl-dipeptidase Dcp